MRSMNTKFLRIILSLCITFSIVTLFNVNYSQAACPPHNYDTQGEVTPATCYTPKMQQMFCSNCGDWIEKTIGSPLGHRMVGGVCTRCGYTEEEEPDPDPDPSCPPHSYGSWETNSTSHWKECSKCERTGSSALHTLVGGQCSICGYISSGTTVPVNEVVINETSIIMNEGDTHKLSVRVLPYNPTNQAVTWSSNSKAIATVATDGTVTAVGAGWATITAVSTVDSTKYDTCLVTVRDILVTGVTLDRSAMTLSAGKTQQLIATVLPIDATNKAVTWSTDKGAVATVDRNGIVTTVGAGSAVITAMSQADNTKYAQCRVTVTAPTVPVTGVTLDRTSMTINVGQIQKLIATVLPSNATNKAIVWSSNASAIATVLTDGTVTAVGAGSAVITAMSAADNTKYAQCRVTVSTPTVPVTGITLNKIALSLVKGNTDKLIAYAIPTNAVIANALWNSSNTSVVTVSGAGDVVAVGVGNTVITATNPQDGKTATCQVVVTDAVIVEASTQIFIVPQGYSFTVYAAGEFTGSCNSWVGVSNPSDTSNIVTASIQTGFNTTKLTGIFNEQGLKSGYIGTTELIFYVIQSPASTTTTVRFTN